MRTTIDAMKQALDIISRTTSSAFVKTMLEEAIAAEEAQTVDTVGCLRCNTPKKCAIHGCSPNTWPSENTLTAVTEQSAFEDWLNSTRPSGDSESVQYQWSQSSELADYIGSTTTAPDTEPAKPPENCGTGHCSCIECVKPAQASGAREALIEECETYTRGTGTLMAKGLAGKCADTLAADALEIEQTCNCRFVGEINTVQCTLHNAWAETLNEQSGYRKELHTLKAQQVAVPQGYVLVQASYLQELCSSIKGDCYRGTLWEIEAITTMLAAAPQPPQADAKQVIPKITVELPDGDQRTVKHWYKEWRNDEIVVSISIDEPQAAPRVPMTDPEINSMYGSLPHTDDVVVNLVRAVEAHHQIGVKP